MQRIFREWLNEKFASWMQTAGGDFKEIKSIGAPRMTKGKTYRKCLNEDCFFILLRYQADRPRVFLSFAWDKKKAPPSDGMYLATCAALKQGLDRDQIFKTTSGWLDENDWSTNNIMNCFEPVCQSLSNHDLSRFSSNKDIISLWRIMGIPDDIMQANKFQRENILTWSAVADIASEMITSDDCERFYGSMVDELRRGVESVLGAEKCWRNVKVAQQSG